MTSAWEEYKSKLGGARPWHLLNVKEYTDDQTSSNRYKICLDCPELISLTKQCKQCGCFMALKVKLQEASCPLQKW